MENFIRLLDPSAGKRILDVGGYPWCWKDSQIRAHVTTINLDPVDVPESIRDRCVSVVGDGTRLPFRDGEFDIVFSNSVIEHLGSWDRQKAFASEVARVGRSYFVQTPAREFFIEPHLMAPFIHWFPRRLQRMMIRNFTVWGWMTRPAPKQVESFLAEVRLLNRKEFRDLFPNAAILDEKALFFTKSYMACGGAKPCGAR